MALYFPGKWIHKVIGGMMLVGVLYAFWPAIAARKNLETFCQQLPAGASLAEVQAQSETRNYAVSPLVDGHAYIDDARSFRRPTCNLQFGPNGLVTAQYSAN